MDKRGVSVNGKTSGPQQHLYATSHSEVGKVADGVRLLYIV